MKLASMVRARMLRLSVAGFCWLTAAYAFTAASPFAYRQFLAPRVFPSVGVFADWHAHLYWLWLALALVGLSDVLGRSGPARRLAAGFGVAGVAAGLYLSAHPILPALGDDSRSLVVGLAALAPVIWLALVDYADAWPTAISRTTVATADMADSDDSRLFAAAVGTAAFFSLLDGVLTPLAVGTRFEPDLLTAGLSAGLGWNLMDQMILCCGAFLVVALVQHLASRLSFAARYGVLLVLFVVAVSNVAQHTVYSALGFSGGWLAAASAATAVSIVSTWSGMRMRRWARGDAAIGSPMELLFGPPRSATGLGRLVPFVGLAAAAYSVAALSRIVDWDFLLLKCGVFALWWMAFDQIFRAAPRQMRIGAAVMAATCLAPLAVYAASLTTAGAVFVPRRALDRYAVYNASFRVADGVLRDATLAGDDPFQRFLRANTGLGSDVDVSPVDVTFASLEAPAASPPDVFLFVVDSLRQDYLQPYNRTVGFTPNLERFGRESLVFRNAFSAYGATGLSVPAIWSGSVGPHKQYVTPFAPMNALAKLLERNHYRQFLSLDSIVRQLVPRAPSMTELDAGLKNEDFTFCRTVAELEGRLSATDGDPRPVFAYSLPQDLHVSNIIGAGVPAGESYPGFHAPYAARVHRIDTCFGEFVEFLKQRGRYDRSLIVVTADHGEMLGEEGRWGHVYYLFPPVIQVPLLVHLPTGNARRLRFDLDAVSLTTDITPTIYAALGYTPRAEGRLMGRPLIGTEGAAHADGRAGDFVLAASYSAVYAALRAAGRQLYIVDAVQHREYAYQRESGGAWRAAQVGASVREPGQRLIREHLHEINRVYRVKARG